jgi:carboxynorspermidine decarboxylase
MAIDYTKVPSPSFVLDEELLRKNLTLINRVQQEAGIEIILAFKGFAMWSAFPVVREYVKGATASSLNEARLCFEEMKTPAHTYAVAYRPSEFDEVVKYSSHITFNSLAQFNQFKGKALGKVSCGLRVNPEWSDVETDLYNPASPVSRLGITSAQFPEELPDGIEGLHFHVLCESSAESLERVLENFEKRFGKHLQKVKWVNMGGGHLMTRTGYDVEHLIRILKNFREKHGVKVLLEPGSAFAWQTGDLVTSVLDIVENGGVKTAILDASFTCHMPDTLEMPYRPEVIGASREKNDGHPYRLGGVSCLAGDFLEAYYFEKPLSVGDQLVLRDMIHYTMVKTTMFNGVHHPDIAIWRNGEAEVVKRFGYADYRGRLS